MKKQIIKLFLLLFFIISLFHNQVYAEDSLTLLIHPYLSASELLNRFSPLVTYLSKESGQLIKIKISKSYGEHFKAVGEGKTDLAYLGPLSYVKVSKIYGKQTLLAGLKVNGKSSFHSIIIIPENSKIKTIEELAGKRFAFGDSHSTMSYLVPCYMLYQKGINVEHLKKFEFLGSHNSVALAVLGGYYDAGGVKEEVFYQYKDRGLKMLAKSGPIAEHLFVANSNLPEDFVNMLRELMINLKDKYILSSIKKTVTGMGLVNDKDYDPLRIILKKLDERRG